MEQGSKRRRFPEMGPRGEPAGHGEASAPSLRSEDRNLLPGPRSPQTRARTHGGVVAAAATAGKKPDFHVRVTERSQKTR